MRLRMCGGRGSPDGMLLRRKLSSELKRSEAPGILSFMATMTGPKASR